MPINKVNKIFFSQQNFLQYCFFSVSFFKPFFPTFQESFFGKYYLIQRTSMPLVFHLQHLDQSASGFIDFSKLLCWPYLNPQYHHSSISATCSIFKLTSSSEYLVSQLDSTIHNKHSNFQIVKNFYKIPIKIQTNL